MHRGFISPSIALAVLAGLGGCTGGSYQYDGYVMETYFPFDGERTWEFISSDSSLEHKIVATLDPNPSSTADATEIYSIDYSLECLDQGPFCKDAGHLRTVRWSADQTRGVLIHSIEMATGTVNYDPPINLTTDRMAVGETVETDSNNTRWIATFQGIGECPVQWTSEWSDCIHLSLDDGGAGSPLAGEYWAVSGYNVIAMQLSDDSGQWQLLYATYIDE